MFRAKENYSFSPNSGRCAIRPAADSTTLVEKNDGAALQVAAQYGEDSSEYESLGRTRKSERKPPRRRTTGDS